MVATHFTSRFNFDSNATGAFVVVSSTAFSTAFFLDDDLRGRLFNGSSRFLLLFLRTTFSGENFELLDEGALFGGSDGFVERRDRSVYTRRRCVLFSEFGTVLDQFLDFLCHVFFSGFYVHFLPFLCFLSHITLISCIVLRFQHTVSSCTTRKSIISRCKTGTSPPSKTTCSRLHLGLGLHLAAPPFAEIDIDPITREFH